MKKYFIVLMLIFIVLLPGASFAVASFPDDLAIDFRTYAGADGEAAYTSADGLVTVQALPDLWFGSEEKPKPLYTLSHDDDNGLGVDSWRGNDSDEIEGIEQLLVTFNYPMHLTGVWISNLFIDKIGKWISLPEFGTVTINDDDFFSFYGSDATDGFLWVDFGGGYNVNTALFETPLLGLGYSNFSVAGFTAPIPGTVFLLGFGLIGLMGLRRKFK